MPSFWRVNMGDMEFTLGLSGWTANDWSRSGNFDLLAPRADISAEQVSSVISKLAETWTATADELAGALSMERSQILGALGVATQEGRVIYDGGNKLWRLRELSADPLPLDKLRYNNEREREARLLVDQGNVSVVEREEGGNRVLIGAVKHNGREYRTKVGVLVSIFWLPVCNKRGRMLAR